MPEYVYAVHDFSPEAEDEVPFRAGERIEVIEKDDQFGDGWWRGRNLAGVEGLFPQSYTTPAPPSTQDVNGASTANGDSLGRNALQTLTEESEGESPTQPHIASPIPQAPQATFLNGNHSEHDLHEGEGDGANGDGEMMKATLTDVQKAIEQLGRNRVDGDGGRSFSFASTRDGGTESDFDMSDTDNLEESNTEGEDWHKGARKKLAEKARKAIEEAERLEQMMGNHVAERRSTAPPIDVELSDESEDDGDVQDHDRQDYTTSSFQRMHPYIPEEDEDEDVSSPADFDQKKQFSDDQRETSAAATLTPQAEVWQLPSTSGLAKEDIDIPTATRATFADVQVPPTIPPISAPSPPPAAPAPVVLAAPPATAATPVEKSITPIPPVEHKRNSAPSPISQPFNGIPSSTGLNNASGFVLSAPFERTSVSSFAPTVSTNPTSAVPTQTTGEEKKERKHPNDWTVEDVVEWLKGRGFDQDVCDKFTEQEITGDVLLEIDVNVLKTEIGILAFGKRMRIANAIQELRRPPSVSSFEPRHDVHTPSSAIHQAPLHSRSQSQAHSNHSFPGTPLYAQSHSGHSSVGSPIGYSLSLNGPLSAHSEGNPMNGAMMTAGATTGAIGLGIDGNGRAARGRPSQLMLSPSDGALKDKVIIEAPSIQTPDEDRAHMSDGDVVTSSQSVRRRLFGRSHDSSSLSIGGNSSRHSKDGTSLAPSSSTKEMVTDKEKEKDKDKDKDTVSSSNTVGSRHRTKRSVDGKGTERLSIFGNTFGGSLGKGRKPPPSEDTAGDSKSVFSRLGGNSVRKSSNTRPSTAPGSSPKASPTEAKDKIRNTSSSTVVLAPRPPILDPVGPGEKPTFERHSGEHRATLRKRASSGPLAPQAAAVADATGDIKQGLSILEQVGTPDHTGWMRKKAVRYNTWKPRYFVLKGEHLYILRSNNKAETRLKGYINIHGYRVTVDETLDPGRYCFRIDHDHDKTHFFSSEEKTVIREWMKAIMKATIGRDYTKPVVSSCNIPTIPLIVAQTMNPAPRPPSPGARDATQKALRRENPNQLSSRDARVLMGLPNNGDATTEKKSVQAVFEDGPSSPVTPRASAAPPRPSREMRRGNSTRSTVRSVNSAAEESLIDWGNSHLPHSLQVADPLNGLFSGLGLLRIAESIKGKPASPPVPDSAFPTDAGDDKLDGLFRLFDFLLDNDVKMGSVSINDVRQGKRDKILQLLRALKAWEDKRRALASMAGSVTAGSFMAPVQYSGY